MAKHDRNHYNITDGMPFFFGKWGFIGGIVFAIGLVLSIIAWVYMFVTDNAQAHQVLKIELIVAGVSFAVNLLTVLFIGYNGFGHNFAVTYTLSVILSVIILFIGGVDLPGVDPWSGAGLSVFLSIILYAFMSLFLTIIPAFLICGLMLLLMNVFGKI